MSAVLPIGYLTILQAAEVLESVLYAGVQDLSFVGELRKHGIDVGDGRAKDHAIAELWSAVDRGKVRALAVGGRPRRIVRLDPELTKAIPTLRSPRGRGFTALRQSNPVYDQLASWFDQSVHTAVLAFRETEIQKLTRELMRNRRKIEKSAGKKTRGRPSRIAAVASVIIGVVDQRKWTPTMGMKALTREVNRAAKWPKPASDETISRGLDRLFNETNDRRFQRLRQKRRSRRNLHVEQRIASGLGITGNQIKGSRPI